MSITLHRAEVVDVLPKGDGVSEVAIKKQAEQQLGDSTFSLVQDFNSNRCEILSEGKGVLTFGCSGLSSEAVVADFDDDGSADVGLTVSGVAIQILSLKSSFMDRLSCWSTEIVGVGFEGAHYVFDASADISVKAKKALSSCGNMGVALENLFSIAKDSKASAGDRLAAARALSDKRLVSKWFVAKRFLAAAKAHGSTANFEKWYKTKGILSNMRQRAASKEAYLAIAKDPKVSAEHRLEAAGCLHTDCSSNQRQEATAKKEAYLAIAKDPKVSAEHRLEAAGCLYLIGQKAAAKEVYLAIAIDHDADSYTRARAARYASEIK